MDSAYTESEMEKTELEICATMEMISKNMVLRRIRHKGVSMAWHASIYVKFQKKQNQPMMRKGLAGKRESSLSGAM